MTYDIPEAVFWCLAVGLFAAIVLLARQRGISKRIRRRNAELADGLRMREEELQHLVSVRLPALETSPATAGTETGLRHGSLTGTEFAASLDRVLEQFSGAVEQAQSRADRSAKAALKTSMRSIQALANEQQLSISEMQGRHDHPDVLHDLLEIDHANAQFGRRAQAIAVLCGSWPGRQRVASPLQEVVRGAKSRIRDYRRVLTHGHVDIAVESRAVESVVLTVAELLDNATRHSQPNTTVEVNIQSVHNGVCVVIDDAGVGMNRQLQTRAAMLLSAGHTVDVTQLDDPPQFGFAVIGVLANRYGFDVSVDTRSPYGGVRAVVFLPASLLTHVDAAAHAPGNQPVTGYPQQTPPPVTPTSPVAPAPPVATAPPAVPAVIAPAAPPRAPEPPAATTAGGLPKRRRRSPQQQPAEQTTPTWTEQTADRSAAETAQRMGAFARGTRFGRGNPNEEGNTSA